MTAEPNYKSYIDYFKSTITSMQENGVISNDFKFGYHSEFFFEFINDVEFTISALSGQITKGIVQCPYQIKIDVREDLTREIKQTLDDMFVLINESIITIDSKKYKQFYTTSTKTNAFIESGANKYNSLVVSATLIECTNILTLDTLEISNVSALGPLVSYAVSYEVETTSTGVVGDSETKSIGKSYIRTWSFVFAANTNNAPVLALLTQVLRGTGVNTLFTIKTKFQFENSATDLGLIVKTGSVDHDLTQGVPLLRVIMVKKA